MEDKYVFVKDYQTNGGTIPAKSEISKFRGIWYMNGVICYPSFNPLFDSLISNDALRSEYLKHVKIEKNEF